MNQLNHSSDNGAVVYYARQLYNVYAATQGLAIYPFYDDCNGTGLYKTDETGKPIYGLNVTLFPNPNNGNFYLDFDDKTLQKAKVKITDITGKIIFDNTLALINGFGLCQNNMAAGVYIVSIEVIGQPIITKKIIVE